MQERNKIHIILRDIEQENALTIEMLNYLIDHNTDLNSNNVLISVCQHPEVSIAMLQLLVNHGCNVLLEDHNSKTCLHHLCENHYIEDFNTFNTMVSYLLEKKADPNKKDGYDGYIPLMSACSNKEMNYELLELFINKGTKLEKEDALLCIKIICENNYLDHSTFNQTISYFLERQNEPNIKIDNTFLMQACKHKQMSYELLQLFIKCGGNIFFEDDNLQTCLHYVCDNNGTNTNNLNKIVGYLLEQGLNPNKPDSSWTTPLMHACTNKSMNYELLQLFVKHGSDVFLEDNNYNNCLYYICKNASIDTLNFLNIVSYLLLEKGMDPGREVSYGYLNNINNISIARLKPFIASGINLNLYEHNHKLTDFQRILINSSVNAEVINFLIENGADINIKTRILDEHQNSSAKQEELSSMEILFEKNTVFRQIIHRPVMLEKLKILIKAGADISILSKDRQGYLRYHASELVPKNLLFDDDRKLKINKYASFDSNASLPRSHTFLLEYYQDKHKLFSLRKSLPVMKIFLEALQAKQATLVGMMEYSGQYNLESEHPKPYFLGYDNESLFRTASMNTMYYSVTYMGQSILILIPEGLFLSYIFDWLMPFRFSDEDPCNNYDGKKIGGATKKSILIAGTNTENVLFSGFYTNTYENNQDTIPASFTFQIGEKSYGLKALFEFFNEYAPELVISALKGLAAVEYKETETKLKILNQVDPQSLIELSSKIEKREKFLSHLIEQAKKETLQPAKVSETFFTTNQHILYQQKKSELEFFNSNQALNFLIEHATLDTENNMCISYPSQAIEKHHHEKLNEIGIKLSLNEKSSKVVYNIDKPAAVKIACIQDANKNYIVNLITKTTECTAGIDLDSYLSFDVDEPNTHNSRPCIFKYHTTSQGDKPQFAIYHRTNNGIFTDNYQTWVITPISLETDGYIFDACSSFNNRLTIYNQVLPLEIANLLNKVHAPIMPHMAFAYMINNGNMVNGSWTVSLKNSAEINLFKKFLSMFYNIQTENHENNLFVTDKNVSNDCQLYQTNTLLKWFMLKQIENKNGNLIFYLGPNDDKKVQNLMKELKINFVIKCTDNHQRQVIILQDEVHKLKPCQLTTDMNEHTLTDLFHPQNNVNRISFK